MSKPKQMHDLIGRKRATLVLLAALVAGVALYAANAESNPRGYYIDESSVSYNAHLIATTGQDEHGEEWPLFFRAFGDYKNPTYIYMLAAIYSVTGPGVLTARLLSAMLGVAAALALGLLGARASGRRDVGLLTGMTALLTPWLFELSRVVVEVAAYPLVVALFLLCVHRASQRDKWSWTDVSALATTLTLLTYTYSIGRLFGPLLALGLVLLATRARLRGLLLVWALYALALVPVLVFAHAHPDALSARFKIITYITPKSGYADDVWEFVVHYAANLNPWRMLVTGDLSANQIANIYGAGVVLFATFALAVTGAYLVIKKVGRDAWWRFVFYGLAASVVPASLTKEHFHMLRLAAVPVFLIVLAVPALAWLVEGGRRRRNALAAVVALTLAQGALFQWQYRASVNSQRRLHLFDAEYPSKIFQTALDASRTAPDASQRRIYLADALAVPGYIQALWQATLRDIPLDTFVTLPPDAGPPEGAVFITTDDIGPRCRELAVSEPYKVCVAEGPRRVYAPLPASGMRAEMLLKDPPAMLSTKEKATIHVVLRNAGDAVWLARERGGSPFQLSLGNHWLDAAGNNVINDDGRGALTRDLRPGEEADISFSVNAPPVAGDYLLEIDMLQEGVSWFGLKGSKTLRVPVRVE